MNKILFYLTNMQQDSMRDRTVELLKNKRLIMTPQKMRNMTDTFTNMKDDQIGSYLSTMGLGHISPQTFRNMTQRLKKLPDNDLDKIKEQTDTSFCSENLNPLSSSYFPLTQKNFDFTQSTPITRKTSEDDHFLDRSKSVIEKVENIKKLGNELFKIGNYKEACEKYYLMLTEIEEARDQSQEDSTSKFDDLENAARLNIASSKLKLEDYDFVIYECSKVLKKSENFMAYYRSAVAYYNKKDYNKAINLFTKAQDISKGEEEEAVSKYIIQCKSLIEGGKKSVLPSDKKQEKMLGDSIVKDNKTEVSVDKSIEEKKTVILSTMNEVPGGTPTEEIKTEAPSTKTEVRGGNQVDMSTHIWSKPPEVDMSTQVEVLGGKPNEDNRTIEPSTKAEVPEAKPAEVSNPEAPAEKPSEVEKINSTPAKKKSTTNIYTRAEKSSLKGIKIEIRCSAEKTKHYSVYARNSTPNISKLVFDSRHNSEAKIRVEDMSDKEHSTNIERESIENYPTVKPTKPVSTPKSSSSTLKGEGNNFRVMIKLMKEKPQMVGKISETHPEDLTKSLKRMMWLMNIPSQMKLFLGGRRSVLLACVITGLLISYLYINYF